jgi:predicted extracellular nuclease
MATLRFSLVLLLLASATACRSGGAGGDDDDGDDDVGDDTAIYDIQSDAMESGTAVTVRGVVVTAIDAYGKYKGDFYVQEPEGGAYSGVQVFASAEIAAGLEVGDLVDIEGAVKDEFALQEDETGRKLTELKAAEGGALTVTKVGDGVVPEPVVVNPWDLTASDEEAEKWEGVVVRFEGARVFYAPEKAESDMTREEMTVTGPYRVESALVDLDDAIARDACFA